MSLAAAQAVGAFYEYFNPTKSPYYAVVVVGTLCLVGLGDANFPEWIFGLVPIAFILAILTRLSFKCAVRVSTALYNDHINFVRAFGLSIALLCMAFTLIINNKAENGIISSSLNIVSYCTSLAHLIMFYLYMHAYHNQEQKAVETNFVQVCLTSSSYLVGLTYCVYAYDTKTISQLIIMSILFLLWAWCTWFMWRYLKPSMPLFGKPSDAEPITPDSSEAATKENALQKTMEAISQNTTDNNQ